MSKRNIYLKNIGIHICTLSASSHISCNCLAIPFWDTFNWFRFETPSKLLQEHFWDCKQLGSYCAEDPLQSNKSEATFKTCFRWNLFEESLFWSEITGNGFLDWRSRRKIRRWNKLVRIWNQLVIKTSLKKNLPSQVVKHNLKMLQTFSQPQHTFKYLVRGGIAATAI